MRIGIVGCGAISKYHIPFAKSYPGVKIVGLVDADLEKARKEAARYNIPGVFASLKELLERAKPEIVHIITPPGTHHALAKEAIAAGCHVLVEKPMTLNLAEAVELYDLAEKRGVKLCSMHNNLFEPCVMKASKIIRDGCAGKIVNVESYYGFNSNISEFRNYPSPNVLHWIYDLPGGIYQNLLPHPLYLLLEFTGRPREIKVSKDSHGILPWNMPDELKITVEGEKALGVLSLSLAAKPRLQFLRIFGTEMMVEADIDNMITVAHGTSMLPRAAQKITYNLGYCLRLCAGTISNAINFAAGRLVPYQGMKNLIHRFYDSIKYNRDLPVSREKALSVIEALDEIGKKLNIRPPDFSPIMPHAAHPVKYKEKILVTGGAGFLGRRLVELLIKEGYTVRVLSRKLSDTTILQRLGAEIFFGDVADSKSLDVAFDGVQVVVHAAADTKGNKRESGLSTISGTQNILELCKARKIKKLVYISSCSVYGPTDYKDNETVTEESALERLPEKRGYYAGSKKEAEDIVRKAMAENAYPITILRPGTIYGPGGALFTPMMGFSFKNRLFVVIGNGRFELSLVYIDNVADAIIKSIQSDKADNQIFTVVDSEKLNKRTFVNKCVKIIYPRSLVIYFPYSIFYFLTWLQEILLKLLGKEPLLTRYRLISSQRPIHYDNAKIVRVLGWRPKVGMAEAIERVTIK